MKTVVVHDRMQQGYRYTRSAPVGKAFDPRFKPGLTPKEMLALGVFGGVYMRDCTAEFPADWFTKARFQTEGVYTRNSKLNYFRVNASQSLRAWQEHGWIHPDDPRGWFQWYCRYYMGRRNPVEDERQITRWLAMRRHVMQLVGSCRKGDETCQPRRRQALLHWAYDSRTL